MAKEAKKDPQELTVEQKLKALFQLQTMLSKIDEIKTLRGELPLEVQDLEDEIAGLSTRIDRIKAEVAELKSSIAGKKVEIETAKASVAKYKDVKKSELDEIISETKQEEEKLRDKAKELETKIEPRLLQSFKRIRKNSRNGLGIVYVQRDACGGCFNKIPPQRQLDIRSRKKIIVCEYCGRIMIDPELAGITPEQKVEVVKEKPVRAKRKIVHIGSDN